MGHCDTATMRIVAISDTHGMHASMVLPMGDILLHGGDWTRFGRQDDAIDFNHWLGTLPHPHKYVIFGNHEANAPWRDQAAQLLSNAKLLCDSGVDIERAQTIGHSDVTGSETIAPLRIWGTDFYWPVEEPSFFQPPFGRIPTGLDVLLTHGPPTSAVDGGAGCGFLRTHVARARPRAVVCGHIHQAHGVADGDGELTGITLANAANAGGPKAKEHSRNLGWPPIVLDL